MTTFWKVATESMEVLAKIRCCVLVAAPNWFELAVDIHLEFPFIDMVALVEFLAPMSTSKYLTSVFWHPTGRSI